jgi:hypothetical protein
MKKNIAIVTLAVALAACLLLFSSLTLHASAMRASNRNVRLASAEVWSQACQHATAGSPARAKWCAWAANQTTISAADEGVSTDDYGALALAKFSAKH